MKKNLILLLFICCATYLRASEISIIPPSCISTYEGLPSGIVAGHVNVASGEFVDFETDLIIPGIQPLALQRVYSNQNRSDLYFGRSWVLNHIQLGDHNRKRKDDFENVTNTIMESSGALLTYKGLIPASGGTLKMEKVKGLTNCGSEEISGRTNLKNQQAYMDFPKMGCTMTNGAGEERFFSFYKTGPYFLLKNHLFANGREVAYDYNAAGNLAKITAKKNDTVYSWVDVTVVNNPIKISVKANDGREITYHYSNFLSKADIEKYRMNSNCYISKVERTSKPTIEYTYSRAQERPFCNIEKKKLAGSNWFVEAQYYKAGSNPMEGTFDSPQLSYDDFRFDKVRLLKSPLGPGGKAEITHRFYYTEIPIHHQKCLRTDVYDAYSHKISYHFDAERRLTAIEKFKGTNNSLLNSRERFLWGSGDDEGNLLACTIEDSSGQPCKALCFGYDKKGNLSYEAIQGNITNLKPNVPAGNNSDSFGRQFTYSQDKYNLKLSVTEGDLLIRYTYVPNSDLKASELVCNHLKNDRIAIRTFYEYNEDGALCKKVIDDGSSEDAKSDNGVTERHIFEYKNKKTAPAYGLPEKVEEYAVDLATKTKHLLKTTFNTYSVYGLIEKQEVRGPANELLYSLEWKYDAHGNLIKHVDAAGREVSKQYDDLDRLILERGPNSNFWKTFSYDICNRLVAEVEHHSDGTQLLTQHSYDYLHNRTSTTDHFKNKTSFYYDEVGKVILKIRPPILTEAGQLVEIGENFEYDVFNNCTMYSNGAMEKTYTTYNVLNQPTEIRYPDGTKESFFYNLNGTLEKSIEKNKTVTNYTYDFLKRLTKKEKVSAKDELLTSHSYTYNAFHLISETDPAGYVTTYTYDYQGRKVATTKEGTLIENRYDPLDRVVESREWFGSNPEDFTATFFAYDKLNNVVEERIEDAIGSILKKIEYAYDVDGNRVQEAVYTAEGIAFTRTEYDTHKNPILSIDAEGNITNFKYNYQAVNARGQQVLEITKIDPLGNQTITIMNVWNKEANIVKKNSLGEELYRRDMFYDGRGNCIAWIDTITTPNAPNRKVETRFHYNSMNNLLEQIEAAGTPEYKRTTYSYNSAGQKEAMVKPDGTVIHYSYDALGRLETIISSDHTIHYSYSYDLNNNLLEVKDHIQDNSTTRKYDKLGNITAETLATGFTSVYAYDKQHRLTEIVLPDESKIEYCYDAKNLKTVQRFSKNGQSLYQHSYSYDLAGNITTATLIKNSGSISYQYDLKQQVTSLEAPGWKEVLTYDKIGNIRSANLTDRQGMVSSQYTYDDLYQLKSENGIADHNYQSDSLFNRLSKDGCQYSVNACNQLLEQGEERYSYDLNGNLISKQKQNSICEYNYDALNRLTTMKSDSDLVCYTYDSFNRRLSKKTNDKTTFYLYQGQKEIAALDANGKICELRVLGIGEGDSEIGAAIALEIANKVYVPIHDHNGNVVSLLDENGQVIVSYRYSAFGETPSSNSFNKWQFASKRFDPETNFIYFGQRYYSPELGRWITPDPQGFLDGPNLYTYVHNNPLTHCDLYGLYTWGEFRSDYWGASKSAMRGTFNGCFHPIDTLGSNSSRICGLGSAAFRNDFSSIGNNWNNMNRQDRINFFAERGGEALGFAGFMASIPYRAIAAAGCGAYNGLKYVGGYLMERRAAALGFESTAMRSATAELQATARISSGAENVNAGVNLNSKLSQLEKAQWTSSKIRNLPDGRIRYYKPERLAFTKGSTRGSSYVTEYNPLTNRVRGWNECYNHLGEVNRVHPKNINGQDLISQHYPYTIKELGL